MMKNHTVLTLLITCYEAAVNAIPEDAPAPLINIMLGTFSAAVRREYDNIALLHSSDDRFAFLEKYELATKKICRRLAKMEQAE